MVILAMAHLAGRNDPQRLLGCFQIRKIVGERVHQTVRDRIIFGIVANILERQDGDVFFGAGVYQTSELLPHGGDSEDSDREYDQGECHDVSRRAGHRARARLQRGGGSVFEKFFQLAWADRLRVTVGSGERRRAGNQRSGGFQDPAKFTGTGVAVLWFLLKERDRSPGARAPERHRVRRAAGSEWRRSSRRYSAAQRVAAGDHLDRDDAQGPNVGALIYGLAEDCVPAPYKGAFPVSEDRCRSADGCNDAGEAEVERFLPRYRG